MYVILVDAKGGFEIGPDVGAGFGMEGFEFEDNGVGAVIISDGILTGVLGPAPTTVEVMTAISA